MRLILLAIFGLILTGRAAEPVKTGSRTLAILKGYGWAKTPEGREMLKQFGQLARAADEEVVPTLRHATSMEVFSLDPRPQEENAEGLFHHYPVRGGVKITPTEIAALRDSLIAGISSGNSTGCFNPRHGIRVRAKGKTMDLVVCFECSGAMLYGLTKDCPPDLVFGDKSTLALLNRVLDRAKIPRDVEPGEPLPAVPVQRREMEDWIDRLGDPAYEPEVTRDGEMHTSYAAALEVSSFGSMAIEPLIAKLRESTDAHQRSVVFHALRMSVSAPEISLEMRKAAPEAPVSPPPPEVHVRLKALWLQWWDENREAIQKLANERLLGGGH